MIRILLFVVSKNDKDTLISFLKKEDGYKDNEKNEYASQNIPPDHLNIEIGIEELDCERLEALIKQIKKRGGSCISHYKRVTRAEQRRKSIKNNAIIFVTTYVSSLIGIPIVSSSLSINTEFLKTAQMSIIPAAVALLSKLGVETKDDKGKK